MEKSGYEKDNRTFYFAVKGLAFALRSERNIRIHLAIGFFAILAGLLFKISRIEWLIIILCICMVMVAEVFNTAIERMVDMVSPGKNDKAGTIKDIAAGAVLIAAAGSVIAGILIFIPYLMETFNWL